MSSIKAHAYSDAQF